MRRRRRVCTTRRPIRTEDEYLYLDLGADIDAWELAAGILVAYLLAAVTSQAECRANPDYGFRVNVENTLLVAKRLIASVSHVVFTSTNLVFDGGRPAPQPYDQTNPIGVYGKQKSLVERELLKLGNATTILRLSKVVQPGMAFLCNWLRDFNSRKTISPFSDAVMYPVPIALAADALFRLGEGKHSGIYQQRLTLTMQTLLIDSLHTLVPTRRWFGRRPHESLAGRVNRFRLTPRSTAGV